MKSINLLFAMHHHQPVGNLEEIFRLSWEKCYDPFLRILESHPAFRISLHYSGSLLEWLEEKQPDFLPRLQILVARKQVELLSGAFYEPLLPFIPEKDAAGQVRLSNHFLGEKLKARPAGFWLAERIWSPLLPRMVASTGLKYTIVDDSHFRYAGFSEEEIFGYYVTECEGFTLSLFPINKRLRYAIPFRAPEETLEILRFYATDSGNVAVTYADDGEKFGIWPGTFRWVYEEGWLEKFIAELEKNRDWARMITFSEYLEKFPPQGRAYLPPASYDEMMAWALPPLSALAFQDMMDELRREGRYEKYWPFLRGGVWENFLVKYSESNHMHKKMLYVSQKVHHAMERKLVTPKEIPPAPVLRALWKGQDCCAYWHGLFGGLYLNYLRHSVYANLIAAESLAETMEHGKGKYLHHEILDFDKDLHPEILVTTSDLEAIFKPNYGGSLVELDYRPKRFNLTNVLTRRPEAYHRKLKKSPAGSPGGAPQASPGNREVEEALSYDWYTRYSFLDHFLGEGTNLDQFRRCQYPELGDFVNQPYELVEVKEIRSPRGLSVLLKRQGALWKREGKVPLEVFKRFLINRDRAGMQAKYEIVNRGPGEITIWFGLELNLTLLAGDDPRRYFLFPGLEVKDRRLCSSGTIPEVEQVGLQDDVSGFGVSLDLSPKGQLWRFPLETVSQSEAGVQKTYQGTVLLFHWPFSLGPGKKKLLNLGLSWDQVRAPGKQNKE